MKLKGKAKAAFLRRMAKGRNKHHGSKRKRKHHTEGHVTKKKRRHHKSAKKSTRRRHHSGNLGRWLPDQHSLVSIGTAFAYGKVEAAASKDTAHFLNKIPAPIVAIGRAGNLGAGVWVAGVVTRHPIVKSVAKGLIHVAAYQNGRNSGGFTKDSPDFKMSGPGRGGHGRDEMLVEQYLQHQRRNG
jgi:hypothetical protein